MIRRFGTCAGFQPHLDAFADGELRGDLLRRVSQHVETCRDCESAVADIQGLGHAIRAGLPGEGAAPDLAGLADGVVSRIRAEEHESWRGKLERATEDLHWVLVAVGSVTAAFVSALIVSAVVQSGVEQRSDSLAAVLDSMAAPPNLGQFAVVPTGFNGMDGGNIQLVSLARINDDGHLLSLQPVSGSEQDDAQAWLGELRRLRFAQQRRNVTDPNAREFVWLFSVDRVVPLPKKVL